jgi:16S rRNA (uracil1498-N3)-methyltransferase
MSDLICVLAPGRIPEEGEELALDPDESHHLVRVRRLREGAVVWAIIGEGTAVRCRLLMPDAREVRLSVEEVVPEWREPVRQVTLFQAVVRGQQMDRIVESGSAIGLFTFVPLLTARVERKSARIDRLQRLAAESAKQCGRGRIPTVESICDWASFIDRSIPDTFLVAHPDASLGLHEVVSGEGCLGEGNVSLAVGPEGDFTPQELAQMREKGALEVHLGPRRLRSEDAALSSLSLLLSC